MTDNRYYRNNQQVNIDRGFDPRDSYAPLESDSLIKTIDDGETKIMICLLCNKKHNIVSRDALDLHARSRDHLINYELLQSRLLDQIPKENSIQLLTLTDYLSKLYNQQSLSDNMYDTRQIIINQFTLLLQQIDDQCTCRPYGSFLTRTSLIHSNINLELIHPNSKLFRKDPRAKNSIHHKLIDPAAGLGQQYNLHTTEYDLISNPIQTLNHIYGSFICTPEYSNFFHVYSDSPYKDMIGKVPKLTLRHVETGILLDVRCYDDSSAKLSELLKIYICLDSRVKELCCLVKYWASICGIDNPDKGTYTPETFIILIIYYLQRTSPPILPCLHEIFPNISNSYSHTNSRSANHVDTLSDGINNLNLRSKPQSHLGDDEKSNQENEQIEEDLDDEDIEDEDSSQYFSCNLPEIEDFIQGWVPQNPELTISVLFIDFMRFTKDELDVRSNPNGMKTAISIRSSKKRHRVSSKNAPIRTKMIEDPIKPKMNMSRLVGTMRQNEYIINCFERAYYYLSSIPLNTDLRQINEYYRYPQDYIKLYFNETRVNSYLHMKWCPNGKLVQQNPKIKATDHGVVEMMNQQLFARDVYVINALFTRAATQRNGFIDLPRSISNSYQKRLLIPNDSDATKFCWLCKSLGHSRQDCNNYRIISLIDEFQIYDSNLDGYADMDELFIEMYRAEMITPNLSDYHDELTNQISSIIKKGLPKYKFKLARFGSTVNNLGCLDSDIDICLTLEDNLTGQGVDIVKILAQVSKILSADKSGKIKSLEPVLSARVPIIRFKYENYDIDLSMYNHCALYNSELLKFYSTIDSRVPVLAYLVKKIAKLCCIADASKGTLSSYAWSLLVIHYLQQVEPPVLPVLQECPDGTTTHDNMYGVSGWNVWFNKDISSLISNPNYLTITQLFKGFFLYYSSFNWDVDIVSIRKKVLIKRYSKSWNNSMLTIEDPFELTYNLACRLDDPMSIYILNTLANSFKHIIKVQRTFYEIKYNRLTHRELYQLLFGDMRHINSGQPPYRGCRVCHRIGHKIKDCPKKREEDEERRKGPNNHGPRGNRSIRGNQRSVNNYNN